jgi:nucleoside-diphosphate-sugar epimerase
VTPVVILGCGYTGKVVARSLLQRGIPVIATSRTPERLHLPGATNVRFDALETQDLSFIPYVSRVVYSLPTLPTAPAVIESVCLRADRVVFLSTTGVYGSSHVVDESTPAAPNNEEGAARLATEALIQSRCASSVVLRAAAIYGPGRGIHVRMMQGRFQLAGEGNNYVSRIHVEDLASHVEASLESEVTGAWPVADELACTSREIADFCARMLGIPLPEGVDPALLHHTRRANRRVDGSAIRNLLGVRLKYPTYRQGIPASAGVSAIPHKE